MKVTIAIPAAGMISARKSSTETGGTPGVGRPEGIRPTIAIPLASKDITATSIVAARTAMIGPGARGAHRVSIVSSARTDMANTKVGQ
ncbi:Uncharacterised protein [Mycobacterium tuberculosis]|uniref:Uncharacterized protein n=1 Tax=Mycobacterium tuberculosis TaxID=1773 RepID=A0A916LEM3_MYCTX|nr:Uncharacterised protein [Mycobacterium tuberculosis]COZ49919.1 Uncharacterised protein [Mycobacterium tuberculosis]COZ67459.1 Uncharacterised protein [Mycobacterium tuberculosis]